MSYVSYKKGTDILTESQQYRLCQDLLEAGFVVYVDDIDYINSQVKSQLSAFYGDKLKFGKPSENIKTFAINL